MLQLDIRVVNAIMNDKIITRSITAEREAKQIFRRRYAQYVVIQVKLLTMCQKKQHTMNKSVHFCPSIKPKWDAPWTTCMLASCTAQDAATARGCT